MNRGEMRDLLRERIQDAEGTWWADAVLDRQLNLSAQAILSFLAANATWINYGRASATINTDGTTTTYTLAGVTALLRPVALAGGAEDMGGRLITERDAARALAQVEDGKDEEGKHLAYLSFTPGAASPLSLTFLAAPPAGTWTLIYDRIVTEIATGHEWTLTLSGFGSGDSFTLTFNGDTTAAVLFAASTAADVKAALNALEADAFDVTGSPSTGYVITYAGDETTVVLACTPTGCTSVLEITGADASTYTEIPSQFHEAVVQHAAICCLSHDADTTAEAAQAWQANLLAQVSTLLSTCPAQAEPKGATP